MKVAHLEHKHGGRVTDLLSIEHEAQPRGMVTWFFTGRVEWDDGTTSERAEISPVCLCYDHASKDAKAEMDGVSQRLMDYLGKNGEWQERGGWKPRAKRGSEALPA